MPKLFGYLNQNNPMTIGDADAQIMYNCSIEHGWIEHKDYPVYDSYRLAVPNRYVKLPNGDEVFIKPYELSRYGSSGFLQENSKTADVTIKIDVEGLSRFELKSTYFPETRTLPVLKMIVNGYSTSSFEYWLSRAGSSGGDFGYVIVRYNGTALHIGDTVEFRFDDSSKREKLLGLSQRFTSDSKFDSILTPSVNPIQYQLAEGYVNVVLNSMSFGVQPMVTSSGSGHTVPYKDNTKHKFRNINVDLVYRKGSEEVTRRLTATEYSVIPHTYNDGSESGWINVILASPIQEYGGISSPDTITAHFTSDYYSTLEMDDFVVDNNGSTKPYEVFYALTTSHGGVESAPLYRTVSVGGNGSYNLYKIYFSPHWITRSTDEYIYDRIRLYRLPWGGSEYLLTKDLDVNNSYSFGSFSDDTTFFNQSDILTTNGDTSILFNNYQINSIILHKDMLFVSYGKLLYYSDVGDYFKFSAKSFLAFPDNVVDIVKHYSYLMVFTEKECYVLSGDDGNTFSVDNIDYRVDTDYDSSGNEETFTVGSVSYKKASTIYNCAQSVYNKVITLVKNHKSFSGRTSVMLVNTRYAYDMTNKVRKFVDYMLPSYGRTSFDYVNEYIDNVNRNRKLENKYYIAEFRKINGSNVETVNLVYDALADGFILYKADAKDSQGNGYFVENNQNIYFKYRTKEFKTSYLVTPQAQYIKGIYVKGCGDFTVNIYGDGEIVSSVTYREPSGADRTALKIIINNVSNKRFSTLSMEFIGLSADAQIHDWEVYH